MKDFLNVVEALGLKITSLENSLKADLRSLENNLQSFKNETQVSIKEINTRFDLFYKVLAFTGALIGLGLTLLALFKG